MVGKVGFEPTAPCSQSRCANQTALLPDKIKEQYKDQMIFLKIENRSKSRLFFILCKFDFGKFAGVSDGA